MGAQISFAPDVCLYVKLLSCGQPVFNNLKVYKPLFQSNYMSPQEMHEGSRLLHLLGGICYCLLYDSHSNGFSDTFHMVFLCTASIINRTGRIPCVYQQFGYLLWRNSCRKSLAIFQPGWLFTRQMEENFTGSRMKSLHHIKTGKYLKTVHGLHFPLFHSNLWNTYVCVSNLSMSLLVDCVPAINI